jgi:hypothetical protein
VIVSSEREHGNDRVSPLPERRGQRRHRQVFAGNRTIVHRSALEGGGTDGVFPNLDQKAFSFLAAAGEKLSVPVRETAAAGTVDVMLVISVEPIA